jgi:hypothetical protein
MQTVSNESLIHFLSNDKDEHFYLTKDDENDMLEYNVYPTVVLDDVIVEW